MRIGRADRHRGANESEILLCAHHLRRSARALQARGALVYDRGGDPLDELATVFAQDR
jgi:hypothetical protein